MKNFAKVVFLVALWLLTQVGFAFPPQDPFLQGNYPADQIARHLSERLPIFFSDEGFSSVQTKRTVLAAAKKRIEELGGTVVDETLAEQRNLNFKTRVELIQQLSEINDAEKGLLDAYGSLDMGAQELFFDSFNARLDKMEQAKENAVLALNELDKKEREADRVFSFYTTWIEQEADLSDLATLLKPTDEFSLEVYTAYVNAAIAYFTPVRDTWARPLSDAEAVVALEYAYAAWNIDRSDPYLYLLIGEIYADWGCKGRLGLPQLEKATRKSLAGPTNYFEILFNREGRLSDRQRCQLAGDMALASFKYLYKIAPHLTPYDKMLSLYRILGGEKPEINYYTQQAQKHRNALLKRHERAVARVLKPMLKRDMRVKGTEWNDILKQLEEE